MELNGFIKNKPKTTEKEGKKNRIDKYRMQLAKW